MGGRMDWFLEMITNPFVLTGAIAWFVAQVIKTILYFVINKKIDWGRMIGDGGMGEAQFGKAFGQRLDAVGAVQQAVFRMQVKMGEGHVAASLGGF